MAENTLEWSDYDFNLLCAILIASENENKKSIPFVKEFILSELINATIMHVKGNSGLTTYKDFREGQRDKFEECIEAYFKKEISEAKNELHYKIRDSINRIVKRKFVLSSHDSSSPTCQLYYYLMEILKGIPQGPDFYMPSRLSNIIKNEAIPALSSHERKDISCIGLAMRPLIEMDLEYIAQNYAW